MKLTAVAGGIIAMVLATSGAAVALSPVAEEALRSSDLIYVATQRANGKRSRVSPIWFFYDQGKIFFTTSPDSWKARRIAKGSPLFIWVGSEDGPFLTGTAEPVTDPSYVDRMGRAYNDKYWIAWLGFFRPRGDRVGSGKTNAYLVTLREGEAPPPAK